MTPALRLLTVHTWSQPADAAALAWLNDLGGMQAPLPRPVISHSVSAAIATGLGQSKQLRLRDNEREGPTHVQLLDVGLEGLVAVSAALPEFLVEGAIVIVDLSDAGLQAALTPFGVEVVVKCLRSLEMCGAEAVWLVGRTPQDRQALSAAGLTALKCSGLPPRRGTTAEDDPSAWKTELAAQSREGRVLRRIGG